jgi:TatD DNase family protein
MIDSHCHLTYKQLHDQLEGVLVRAARAGVTQMVTIGTTIPDARQAIALCKRLPNVRCAVGIHPHYSADATPDDLAALAELEREDVVVAVGEMGLDYHYDFSPKDRQKHVFEAQLRLAKERNRPIVIHCREAVDDCLAILVDFPTIPAVFHCFTGTAEEARRIIERGYYLGFTGVVTYKRSDELRQVARFVPADRFLVETDAPYLSPEPMRKMKVNEPSFVVHTADAVAAARGVDRAEIDRLTTENCQRLFRFG